MVNAAGFVTSLGGAPVDPLVLSALAEASGQSWDAAELSEYTGAEIATLAGVPAACVVAGAAAGLALAVAACAVLDSPGLAAALPVGGRFNVVAQATLHNSYDRMARLCGAEITSVGYSTRPGLGQTMPWELAAALDDTTVAVLHTVTCDSGALLLPEVAQIAHSKGVPVVVDAAASLPPAANLREFVDQGADLVVFSGGKALRGPQASGLLLGKADLVRSARLQQLDMDADRDIWRDRTSAELWQHGIGRAMKVAPETMLATTVAVRQFLTRDHEGEANELAVWLRRVAERVGSGRVIPPGTDAGYYPSLVWGLGPDRARRAWRVLASKEPSIRLGQSELGAGLLRLRPEAVSPAQRDYVTAAMCELGNLADDGA